MITKTYYALLEGSSSVSPTPENKAGVLYKSFCSFMGHLTASNVASLIAWNSGNNASSASFNERGYWDESNPFGQGAHSIWRFNTSSTRNWEWYLYVQVVSGANGVIRQTFNVPISGYAAAADNIGGSAANRGIIMQAAVCVSGTTSFNPWSGSQGTPSFDGNSTAGNPRWISGSADRRLYVLPRSNDIGSSNPLILSQKSNAVVLGSQFASSEANHRYNFICDGDAILALVEDVSIGLQNVSYVGAFELRTSLSGSGFCGNKHGLAMYSSTVVTPDGIRANNAFGDLLGTSTANGGIAAPIPTIIDGAKIGIPAAHGTFFATTYQPNTVTGLYDEFPIYVGVENSDAPMTGMVGNFNTGLVRYIFNVTQSSVTADMSRAVFGASNTVATTKLSVPWTGSVLPGTGSTRTGTLHTWTKNYG